MTPLVSVILPFHNAERWLAPALRSLAMQRQVRFEVIAVDDGSTDASVDAVNDAVRQGLPLRLLRNERNLGIVAALNRALDAARGSFIARMDADDLCMRGRFERQVAFLEETGCDICGSWFVEIGQGIPRTVHWPHTEPALRAAMLFQNTLCHPTVMARREVFDCFRYREEYRLVEDYDLFGRASGELRIANIPEVLLQYRRHPQQATQAKRDAMETVTRRIRLEILRRQGFSASPEEQRLHNLIRAPYPILDVEVLQGIEAWLLKLEVAHDHVDAKRVVASQWVRACIRAAPLGGTMWKAFRSSALREIVDKKVMSGVDLWVLSMLKLGYDSKSFAMLRRLGLSV